MLKKIEMIFETVLFNSRFITLFAVIGTLAASVVMFLKGTLRILNGISAFCDSFTLLHPETAHETEVVLARFITAVDNYLFAMVLVIFSMGIYELFISEIDPAGRKPDTRPDWLKIRNLDQLKESLGKVILMILIVEFFEKSMRLDHGSSLDLLYMGIGIILMPERCFYRTRCTRKRKTEDGYFHAQHMNMPPQPLAAAVVVVLTPKIRIFAGILIVFFAATLHLRGSLMWASHHISIRRRGGIFHEQISIPARYDICRLRYGTFACLGRSVSC
jgi:uncharacterized membrane protein YqhA